MNFEFMNVMQTNHMFPPNLMKIRLKKQKLNSNNNFHQKNYSLSIMI
jgi:hypothetical protein